VIPLGLAEVDELTDGELTSASGVEEITGVQVDSRRVLPGDLFVAVGAGAEFCGDALARGAAATLIPSEAFAALAALGAAVRERASARVVGITGSTGKTSTKDILAALCAPSAKTIAAEASYNNEIGVPLTLCRLEPDTEVCILELAMRGFGQIAELCRIAKPELGIITNVGPAHLELVGSMEGVVEAKGELVAALPPSGTAIVPADFPVVRDDVEIVRLREPEVVVEAGRAIVDGVSFNLPSRHQAANAAAALAALDALGIERPDRVDVELSRWRGDEVPLPGGGLLINDAYNANPVSMRAALVHLVERADGRRTVAVLGEMAELGAESPRFHREVGDVLVELGVDVLFAVGPLARNYEAGGLSATAWEEELDAPALARAVGAELRPGDCVLVKASRAVGLEAVAEELAAVSA
jgi:UDP-N-acetylmuramoyl-tripeptide--D-alanyl-D-alanine ligase